MRVLIQMGGEGGGTDGSVKVMGQSKCEGNGTEGV